MEIVQDIIVPMHASNGYIAPRVEVTLPDELGCKLRDFTDGLRHQGAKLSDGGHVLTPQDAIRYLLERLTPYPD